MDKVLKRAWVTALRSGKYKQGKGRLKKTSGGVTRFCCLGVLREICPAVGQGNQRGGVGLLPVDSALKVAKLKLSSQQNLANMNDGRGYTFEQISNYIERHL